MNRREFLTKLGLISVGGLVLPYTPKILYFDMGRFSANDWLQHHHPFLFAMRSQYTDLNGNIIHSSSRKVGLVAYDIQGANVSNDPKDAFQCIVPYKF